MSKCKCGRKLRPSEERCPACSSKKSHRWKKVVEVAVGAVALVGGIVIYILTGGEGGESA